MGNSQKQHKTGLIAGQSSRNALLIFVGIGIGFILTVFIYPNVLSPDQYGLTRVLVAASVIGAQFAHLGVRNTVIRYFPLFKRVGGKDHGLLGLALLVPFVGFLMFLLAFFLFRDTIIQVYESQSPLFTDYLLLLVPLTLFILYFEVFNSYLRSLNDSVTGTIINDVVQRVMILLILVLFFFGVISFDLFILLFVMSYGVQVLLMVTKLYGMGEFRLKINPLLIRKRLLKGMGSYGLFTLLGGLSSVIVWNIDVIMLGSLTGLEQTAVYAIAFYIGSVITVPQRAIDKIAAPVVSRLFKEKDFDGVDSVYRKSCLNQLLAALVIFGLIWVNIDAFFHLLPDVYAGGKWVVFFIGIGKIFDMMTGLNGTIIKISKHYKFDLYTTLFLVLLTITTNLILIPIYGIIGAALATMISILIYNVVKYVFLWMKFGMQPISTSFLWLIVLAVSVIYLIGLIPSAGFLPDLAIRTLSFAVLFIFPIWYLNVSPDLNEYLRKW